MKIRMTTNITGLIDGESWPNIGDVAEVSDAAALHAIEAGHAEPADKVVDDAQPTPEPEPEPDEEQVAEPAEDSDPEPVEEPKPAKKPAKKRSKKG